MRSWFVILIMTRLRLATTRLEDAQQERIWAIAAAQEAGLSIRQIAAATGLSPSRIHQLLKDREVGEIPVWLSQLHNPTLQDQDQLSEQPPSTPQTHLAAEVEVLRWCVDWLERLERNGHGCCQLATRHGC